MKHILDWPTRRVIFVRALLTFALAFMLAPLASAQTNLRWNEDQVSWQPVTTCDDGSPGTDCPVTGYRVETAKTCTATTWALAGRVAPSVLTFKATGVAAGLNCYRVKAESAAGDSGSSNTASMTSTPPLPAAPTGLTVSDVVAYEVRENSQGVMIASRIGIVPQGSICSADTRAADGVTYNRVDPQSVDLINFPKALKPVEAWAKCS